MNATKILVVAAVVFVLLACTTFACGSVSDGFSGCYTGPMYTRFQQPVITSSSKYVGAGCDGCYKFYSAQPLVDMQYAAQFAFRQQPMYFGPSNIGSIGNINIVGGLAKISPGLGSSNIGSIENINIAGGLAKISPGLGPSNVGKISGNLNIGIFNPFCDS
jgi:hypothetical protein